MPQSKRLNVVHVSFGLDVGGLEKLLLEFAHYTDGDRYRLTFVSLGNIGRVGVDLRRAGFPVVCLHRGKGFRPSLVFQLRRLFKIVGADIVHTHDPRPLIYAAPAAKLAGVGTIVHTQHGRVFGQSNRQLWMMRKAARCVDRFVCVSNDIRQLAGAHGIDAAKLVVVHNGIGGNRFGEQIHASAPESNRNSILAVARLSPEKGLDTLIDAMAIAVETNPSIRLMIAGDGPCREALEDQINDLDLVKHVRLFGQIDDIPRLFSFARLFVLPSRSEGISLTLLEAMLSRVPIIATDVGGTPELIHDRETGLLVPPSDPEKMAEAILELWSDDSLQSNLVKTAKHLVDAQFSIDQMIDSYDSLYRHRTIADIALTMPPRREVAIG